MSRKITIYILFLVVICLFIAVLVYIIRSTRIQALRNLNYEISGNSKAKQLPPNLPTTIPYHPGAFLTPLSFKTYEINITQDTITTSDTSMDLRVGDVVLVLNRDTIKRTITIDKESIVLSPREVRGYKVHSSKTLTVEVFNNDSPTKTFSFPVQN